MHKLMLGLLLLPMAAMADGRVDFYLGDGPARKSMLKHCMQMTVPQAAKDKECQAARSADRKSYSQAPKMRQVARD